MTVFTVHIFRHLRLKSNGALLAQPLPFPSPVTGVSLFLLTSNLQIIFSNLSFFSIDKILQLLVVVHSLCQLLSFPFVYCSNGQHELAAIFLLSFQLTCSQTTFVRNKINVENNGKSEQHMMT